MSKAMVLRALVLQAGERADTSASSTMANISQSGGQEIHE